MGKRLTDGKYIHECMVRGKNAFIRRSTNLSWSHRKEDREQINEILRWLDIVCVQPYYVNRDYEQTREGNCLVEKVVFYFLDEQDKAVFTLCYGELF